MTNVRPWPLQGRAIDAVPKKIKRPCDFGLELAVMQLVTQLGTIEAYNRLVAVCDQMRIDIVNGKVEAQNPLYAVDIKGGTELPRRKIGGHSTCP